MGKLRLVDDSWMTEIMVSNTGSFSFVLLPSLVKQLSDQPAPAPDLNQLVENLLGTQPVCGGEDGAQHRLLSPLHRLNI